MEPNDNQPKIFDVKFYAAILHPDGTYAVEQFDTVEALADRLTTLIDKDVSVFNFAGTQLKISKPPFRHLITPWVTLPLFNKDSTELEPDESGYLGLDPIHLMDPPQLPAAKSKMPVDNEFFDDDDGASLGVFDSVLPDPDS
jgi:hypothetical protein